VVRSFLHKCFGKRKKASNSGRSRSSCLTKEGSRGKAGFLHQALHCSILL
jgi:hypothetical protein